MIEQCRSCRFWLPFPECIDNPGDDDLPDFGSCRRHPPVISDHMASIAIQRPAFGGNHVDPDDIATAHTIHNACLRPSTFFTDWCGEFQQGVAK